jgi:leucine efflux protein
MFEIQNYGSFIAAVIIFQMIPGAGTITILNATARQGIGSGMKAVVGTLSGDFIYMLAAVLGLAAMLNAYPGILASAQWIGVAYLCWTGYKLVCGSAKDPALKSDTRQNSWIYFRQALAISLTNPKVIMFFMAFFPLFLSAQSTPVTLVALMLHVTAISFLYQAFLVFAGNAAARYLSQWPYARRIATRLAGTALICFGMKLAFIDR